MCVCANLANVLELRDDQIQGFVSVAHPLCMHVCARVCVCVCVSASAPPSALDTRVRACMVCVCVSVAHSLSKCTSPRAWIRGYESGVGVKYIHIYIYIYLYIIICHDWRRQTTSSMYPCTRAAKTRTEERDNFLNVPVLLADEHGFLQRHKRALHRSVCVCVCVLTRYARL